MQVAAINRAAQQNYATFKAALVLLQETVDEQVRGLIAKVEDADIPGTAWAVPSADELKSLCDKAVREIEQFSKDAKDYEAELISRNWRV
ncbi:hypothetical protein [Actinosynnema mirum]|uniref:Uncharacterized protein n=1 Tax=Actinosynnema mirum (strain ATCC 29888 / DSM 43827 / JCM 3225 / NBRC 14064 / NCIMB 13271 / NRRL B-12336 / IMRU 3971 / 101) TaxID=446462 RepID=C6WRI6_ACTMD|nr:hypothetical protein [Actinosynnema mirum]ACU35238.1 hypothetical protein Amir_1286 [Actinosynnema mirum DSM 43827]